MPRRALLLISALIAPLPALADTHVKFPAFPVGATTGAGSSGGGESGGRASEVLPAYNNAAANWTAAGLAKIGGIPTRTTQCGATLTPSGGNDATRIQNAIKACPAGQVVQLGAGTFQVAMENSILLNKGITIRGTGNCANAVSPHCQTVITVSNGQLPTYAGGGQCGTGPSNIVACVTNSVFMMSPTGKYDHSWSGCSNHADVTGCGAALDADAAQGDKTIRVRTLFKFLVGDWVRIDELSGAVRQTDPANASGTVFAAPDLTAAGAPATGKVAYAGSGVEIGYGSHYDRVTSEIHKIAAIGAGPCPGANCTITFDTPLTIAYRTGHSAQVYYAATQSGTKTAFLEQAGIENLTITRATGGPVFMTHCAYCWIKNVETSGWSTGIGVENSARVQVSDSYLHDCYDCENNGVEYPLAIDGGTTESLFTNNIIRLAGKGMVGRSCGGGNVISYNYVDATFYMQNGGIGNYWVDLGLNSSHYVGCHHTLFEGNWASNCDNDETHGNTVYHTYFRNHCTGMRSAFNDPSYTTATSLSYNAAKALVDDANGVGHDVNGNSATPGPLRAAAMMRWNYWMAFVGNVLGTSGQSTSAKGWSYAAYAMTSRVIWMIGWSGGECDKCQDKYLNGVNGSYYFRHGNYDYLNAAVIDWQPGYARTLPNSLYLAASPQAFAGGAACTYAWPWVSPETGAPIRSNSCAGSGLPAKARWDAGAPFVQP